MNLQKSPQSPKNIFRLSQDQKIFIQHHLPKGFALISQSKLHEKKRKSAIQKSILQNLALKHGTKIDQLSPRPIRKVVSQQKKKSNSQIQKSLSLNQGDLQKSQQKEEQSCSHKDQRSSNKKQQSLQSNFNRQNSTVQETQDNCNKSQQNQRNSNQNQDDGNELEDTQAIATNKMVRVINLKDAQIINSIFRQQFYILKNLKQHDSIQPFLYAVDQIRDSAPDYYCIIKQPVDLQTIQEKMFSQIYKNPKEFHQDIQKMLDNSRIYNQGNPCMIKLTNQIQKFYQKLIRKNRTSKVETVSQNESVVSRPVKQTESVSKKEIIKRKKQMKEK